MGREKTPLNVRLIGPLLYMSIDINRLCNALLLVVVDKDTIDASAFITIYQIIWKETEEKTEEQMEEQTEDK